MLLQKVNHESQKPGSGNLMKVVVYLLMLGVAYFAGYEHAKSHSPAPDSTTSAAAPVVTPASDTATPNEADSVPLSTPEAVPSSTPAEVLSSTPPTRIEKASPVIAASSKPAAAPPVASPVKQANQVTITTPVEIPVKDDSGKVTGYINLQKGQLISPVSVDHDQIKIKSGNSFVMVPVSSTDMAH